ncbi:MAG: HNH endonuclease [Mycobacterium sp.]|nr:HNH endonuclease [Mycobacterium sp.]
MPRASKHCGINGCTVVVPNGKRCAQHSSGWKTSPRTASSGRTSTSTWKSSRVLALQRDGYLCQIRGPRCTVNATQVDHVINVANGGSDDLTNLQSTCKPCHDSKTAQEAQKARA